MKKVHPPGHLRCCRMPEGHNVRRILLYRRACAGWREWIDRGTASRPPSASRIADGNIAGMIGINTRTAEPIIIRAKAVIMPRLPAGAVSSAQLGLPVRHLRKIRPTAGDGMPWPTTGAPIL